MNEIIEVQELTVLYKQQKTAKKLKRLEQKKRGKNYVPPKAGLTVTISKEETTENKSELKRLYRETMLLVHPDKFSTTNLEQELATDLTTQLVNIYQEGDLESLKSFHAKLTSTNPDSKAESKVENNLSGALETKLAQLTENLASLKSDHLYQVLESYSDYSIFINKLQEYYKDRITKLKRRTRTK